MDEAKTIQFLVKEHRLEKDVLDSINSIFDVSVETVNFRVKDSLGFLQFMEYNAKDFGQVAIVSFPSNIILDICEEEFIKKLATLLNTSILLQPDDDENEENPWALAFPNNPVLEKVYVDFLDDGIDIRKD